MKITRTDIEGLLVIEPDVFTDSRGCFYESYNSKKFIINNLEYFFVQDLRIAVPMFLPVAITHHRGWRRARLVILRSKHASQEGFDTQHGEVISRNQMARDACGFRRLRRATGNTDPGFAAAKRAQSLVALIMLEKVFVGLVRKTPPLPGRGVSVRSALATRVGKQNQFLRFVHRQLLESYRVEQREDCSVGADAQRECADRDHRESGSLDEIPDRVTNIAIKRLHGAPY